MEKRILGQLEWNLTAPTPYVFLVRFTKASTPDPEMENMVYFWAELAMMNYATIMYCPSMIAASAVYAARCTLNKIPSWHETLKLHTGFSEPQLMDCAKLLVSFHSMAADHKLKVIYRKYSNPQKGAVAMFPPAKALAAPTIGLRIRNHEILMIFNSSRFFLVGTDIVVFILSVLSLLTSEMRLVLLFKLL